jgi:lipopolysaccharide/colanic/teichoic acid biosynthesis glycosyltransferase
MFYRAYGKRALDVVGASIALLLLSPVLMAAALAIKFTSPGPIFYTQRRVGRGGCLFDVIKFRTMVVGAERLGTGVRVTKDDPRVTASGKFLRAWSIDELPQLFNVLAGSMSVIGPRPGLPYQAKQYDAVQRRRLDVRPGISGWAQVNGRNSIPWDQRIRYDLEYVDRQSLWLDCCIAFKTIRIIFLREQQFSEREFFKAPEPELPTSCDRTQAGNGL